MGNTRLPSIPMAQLDGPGGSGKRCSSLQVAISCGGPSGRMVLRLCPTSTATAFAGYTGNLQT